MIARVVASICRELLSGFYAELEAERRAGAGAAARAAALPRFEFITERMEPRLLLTSPPSALQGLDLAPVTTPGGADIVALGVPQWRSQGPGPMKGGLSQGIDPDPTTGVATNPVSGAVETILPHPTNPNIIYIGTTGGGIWKTSNATASFDLIDNDNDGRLDAADADERAHWQALTDQLPLYHSITALAFDPNDASRQTVYAGTGQASAAGLGGAGFGLLKTTDGGTHWTVIAGPLQGKRINSILVTSSPHTAPATGHVTLVATPQGLYRSKDDEGTFELLGTAHGLPASAMDINDLKVDPLDPSKFYIGVAHRGVFISSGNAGASWTAAPAIPNVAGAQRIELGISAAGGSSNPVYAGVIVAAQGALDVLAPKGSNVLRLRAGQSALFNADDDVRIGTGATAEVHKVASINFATDTLTLKGTVLGSDRAPGVAVDSVRGIGVKAKLGSVFRWNNQPAAGWQNLGAPRDAFGGIHPGGQAHHHFSIVADPTDEFRVYVGGDRESLSPFLSALYVGDAHPNVPAASVWTSLTRANANNTGPHPDSRFMVFDQVGDILQGDDGGIYRLQNPANDPQKGVRKWTSLNTNLALTEFYNVAWDATQNRIIGAAQDNGVAFQDASNSSAWTTLLTGDGIRAETVGGNNYFAAQGHFFFVNGVKTTDRIEDTSLEFAKFDKFIPFATPFAINRFNPKRMLVGTGGTNPTSKQPRGFLYESIADSPGGVGAQLTLINGDVVPKGDAAFPSVGGSLGRINVIVYGGMLGATQLEDVGYVGTSGQNTTGVKLFFRETGPKTEFLPIASYKGGPVRDIAMDPTDWRKVYVLDAFGKIHFSDRAADVPTWVTLHDNPTGAPDANDLHSLPGASSFQTIEVVRVGSDRVVLVGAAGGVFRRVNAGPWHEFGHGLPNSLVTDIDYNEADDVLLVSTLGRGAWTVSNASQTVAVPSILEVTGTAGADRFVLRRNADEPWVVDVYHFLEGGAEPTHADYHAPLASLAGVQIFGLDGNDRLTIDPSFGALEVPRFDYFAGAGTDQLHIVTGAKNITYKGFNSLANPDGHVLGAVDPWGQDAVQEIFFDSVESPVEVNAPVAATVDTIATGLSGIGESLQDGMVDIADTVALPGFESGGFMAGLNGLFIETPNVDQFPILSARQAAGLTQIDNASSLLRRLLEEGLGAFSLNDVAPGGAIPDPEALRAALDGLDNIAGNVTFTNLGTTDADGNSHVRFHAQVVKRLSALVEMDVHSDVLGSLGQVHLNGTLKLGTDVHLDLTFGVDADGFFLAPSVPGAPALRLTNMSVDGSVNGGGRLGFLGVDVTDATLALDPGVELSFSLHDPGNAGADNIIRMPELTPPNFAELIGVNVNGDPGDGQDDLVFDATFGISGVIPTTDVAITLAEARLPIRWVDFSVPTLADLVPVGPDSQALRDFLDLASQDILPHLTQVASQLAAAQSMLDFDVPFMSGDSDFTHLVDVVGAFTDKILDPLRNADGSPAFQTLQDVVGLLAGSLGVDLGDEPIVSYDSDTGALAFHVPMTVVFDPVTRQLVLASNTAEGASFGNVSADLEAALTFDFTFGYNVKSADPIETFFFQINELSASLTGALNAPTLSGNVGTFRTTVANASVEFGVDVAVLIDDTGAPGLSLGELAAFNDADVTANTRLMFAASGVGGSIGGSGLGVSMTGAQIAFGLFGAFDNTRATQPPTQFALDVSVPNGGIALIGAGDALSLSGGGTVRWNSDTANAVFEEEIGNSGIGLDLPAGHKLATVQGRLSIPNLVDFDGSVAFDLAATPSLAARDLNGSTVNVSVFKFGASNISGFAGVYENGVPSAGLLLEDVDVALALMRPTSASDPRRFFALETTIGNIDVIGFGDANDPNNPVRLDVSNVAVNVNGALNANLPAADVAALNLSLTPISVPTGPGSSITLDYAAELLQVSATLSLSTDSFDVTTTVTGGVVNDEPQWLIEVLDVDLENGVHVHAEDVELNFEPASTNAPVLSVGSGLATFEVLGEPLTFAVTGLNLRRSGAFEFTSASLTGGNLFALSDFLPLTLTNLQVTGLNGQPARFDAFTVTADGVFSDTLFQNDLADPVIELGQVSVEAGNTFGFGIEVNGSAIKLLGRNAQQQVVALAGPLKLGFVGMTLGALEFDAKVTLGQFTGGVYQAAGAIGFEGKIRGADGGNPVRFDNGAGAGISEIGFGGIARVTHPNNGTLLDIDATVSVSFDTGPGGLAQLAVDNLAATFDLKLDLDQNFAHRSSRVALDSVSAGQVDVRFGEAGDELLLLRSTTAQFNFDENVEPFMRFGSISASLPKLQAFLLDDGGDPLTGTVFDFAIGHDFSFLPGDNFEIRFDNIPRPEAFGLPDWIPFYVDSIGIAFGPGALAGENLDLILTVTAGVNTDENILPIRFTAEVSDLSVNLGTLADIFDADNTPTAQELLNAVTFDGFLIGIEGLKIGEALEIGGKFGLRMIQDNAGDNALVATIGGFFGMAGIGGGIELTIAEVGPVMAKLDVPLGIPLGPSGIILSGVSGGFRFGGPNFGAPDDPLDLLTAGTTPDPNNPGKTQLASIFDPLHFDPDELDNEIRRLLALGLPTWTQSFTVALEGEATTIASPGILDGALTLAAQIRPGPTPAISFVGAGEITLFGLPVGAVGAILDFTEPLSPTFDLAYAAPIPGSPIAFLFPAQTTFTVQVDTQGLIELPLVGLQAFLNGAAGSALDNLLAEIAEAISADRQRPLARALIDDLPANSPITGPALKSLLLGKLPVGAQGLAALSQTQINDLADISSAILAELFDVGRQLTAGQWDEVFDDLKTFIEIGASAAIETFDNATGAARQALMSFWDRFNPRMVATGKVQPTILGFPFGEATQGSFRIDKDGFSLGFTGSIIETMQTVADLYFLPIFGTSGIPGRFIEFMTLGIEDHTTFTVGLDGVDDLFQSIAFGGGFPNLNPELDFSASFSSTLSFLGFNLVQVSGAMFSPGSSILAFGDDDDVSNGTFLRVYNLPLDEQDAGNLSIPDAFNNLIPIERPEDEIAFNTYGGFLLTGQLLAPEMLTDPVGLIADMIADGDFVPTANLIAYLTNLVDQLTRDEELGRLQLYLPSMASIFDVTVDALGRQRTNPVLSAANQAEDLIDEIFFRGFLTSKVLSFNYGRASFEVTSDGIVVHGEIPWLLGLDATLTLDMATVNMNQVVEALAGAAGHNVNLRNIPQLNVPVPVGAIVLTLDAERMARLIAQQFHLPENVFVPGDVAAQARLALYSPGFGLINGADPDDVSAAQRTGGVELSALLDVGDFIDDARFVFEAPLFIDDASHFHAEAHIEHLRIPGIGRVAQDILSADLHALLDFGGGDFEFALDGNLRFLNLIDAGIDAFLHINDSGIWGSFELLNSAGDGGLVIDAGLFKLTGSLVMRVNTTGQTRDGIPASPQFMLRADAALSIFGGIDIPDDRVYNGLLITGNLDLVFTKDSFTINSGIDLVTDFPFPIPNFGEDTDDDGINDKGIGASASLTVVTNSNANGARSPAIDGSLTIGDITLSLDRFGVINDLLPIPFIGNADQHVIVDDQRFNETNARRSHDIVLRLSKPAEHRMVINYRLRPGSAARLDDYDADDAAPAGNDITGSVTIEQGDSSAVIPFDVLGDLLFEPDERFRFSVTSATYDVDDPPPIILGEGAAAWITIVDNDPRRVLVDILPGVNMGGVIAADDSGRLVFRGSAIEGGSAAVRLVAQNLAAGDSVVVRYRVILLSPTTLQTATLGEDFAIGALEGLLTLTGGTPQDIGFTTFPDFLYELNEEFEIQFEIVQGAASATVTTLAAPAARIAVENDDFDQPGGSLVFYDFDDFSGPGQHYTGQPKYVDPLLNASDFRHSSEGTINSALRFNGLRDHVTATAGSTFTLPTGLFTVDFWINPENVTPRQTVLVLGSGSGLVVFIESGALRFSMRNTVGGTFTGTLGTIRAGRWQHVALVYNGNAATATSGGSTMSAFIDGVRRGTGTAGGAVSYGGQQLTIGANRFLQENFAGRIDEVRLWTNVLNDTQVSALRTQNTSGTESNLLINYRFDEGQGAASANATNKGWTARLGSTLGIFGPFGRPDWIEASDSPFASVSRYAQVTRLPDGVPKVPPVSPASDFSFAPTARNWAGPGVAITQAPFFAFSVGRDAPTTPTGSFDIRDMLALRIDGIDFFNRAASDGPTRWELRSSRDNFTEVLAEGDTVTGADFQHAQVMFDTPLRFIHPNAGVTFRLYGLDANGAGGWTIDNFALIAGVESPNLFNLPPIRPPIDIATPIDGSSPGFDVIGGASDPNGDPIVITDITVPVGSLTQVGGQFVYTPPPGHTSDVPITFTITDHWGASVTTTVTARMIGDALDDAFSTPEDTPLSSNVLGNDKLIPNQPVSVTPVGTLPASVQLNSNGTFTFTPPSNSNATVTFTYRVNAPNWSDTASVTLTVTPVNDVPAAVNRTFTVNEDTTLTVTAPGLLSGIVDPDRDPLTVILTSGPSRGTLTFNANGSFTYVPLSNDDTSDSFFYQISDGTGLSPPARVDIDILAVNDRPIAGDNTFTLDADTSINVAAPGILNNDSDIETPLSGLRASVGTNVSNGTLVLNPDGSFSYTPVRGFFGTDGFKYVVTDANGGTDVGVVTFTITPPNRPPTPVNDTRPAVNESTTATLTTIKFTMGDILANDTDPDGGPITITRIGPASIGTISLDGAVNNAATVLTYTAPTANVNGTVTIPYVVTDAKGLTASATVTLTINPTNDAPVAVNDLNFALNLNNSSTISIPARGILGNDTDVDHDALSLTAVLVSGSTLHGTLTLNANGSFTITYPANTTFRGTDVFTYQARDPLGALSNVGSVQVTVIKPLTLPPPPPPLPPSPPPTLPPSPPPPLGSIFTIGGYLAYGRLGFDANNNHLWEFADVNGNGVRDPHEIAEPVADMNRSGRASLFVNADVFDLDGDGVIEPAEGTLLAFNGTIAATLQPLLVPLGAPLGASVITPLTTIVAALMAEQGMTAAAAQAAVRAAFNLPNVDILSTDPIALASTGGADAARYTIAHVQLHNTYALATTWLSAFKGLGAPQVAGQWMSLLSARLADGGAQPIDLTDASQITGLLNGFFERFELPVAADAAAPVAQVIAALNAAAAAAQPPTPSGAGASFLESVYRVEAAAQGRVVDALVGFAVGDLSAAALVAANTGAPLLDLIASTKLGAVTALSPDGASLRNLLATPANEGGVSRVTGIIGGVAAGDAVSLRINWDDGHVEDVALPNGATSFSIDHVFADESPLRTASDTRRVAVMLMVNGAPAEVGAVAAVVRNTAPVIGTATLTPMIVAGGVGTLSAAFLDAGLLDSFKAEIDWGDGMPVGALDLAAGTTELSARHTYARDGKYTVTLHLTDSDGARTTRAFALNVVKPLKTEVERFAIDDGSKQRSMVRSFTVVFNQPVDLDASLITLRRADGVEFSVSAANPSNDGRTWQLTPFGPGTIGTSLPDGRYTLTIPAAAAVNGLGEALKKDYLAQFHRFFGDTSGNGQTEATEQVAFKKALGSTEFSSTYISAFDFDGDGDIDAADEAAFNQRLGRKV